MKKAIIILFVYFSIFESFGQDSGENYVTTRIIGAYEGPILECKREIIRTDTIIYLCTKSSKLKIKNSIKQDGLNFYDQRSRISKINTLTYDSLGILLFNRGFLTTDMLIKAHNVKRIEVTSDGDTTNITSPIDSADYILYNILVKRYKYKKQKKFVEIDIQIIHGSDNNKKNDNVYMIIGGTFSHFRLELSCPFEATPENLLEYIKQAKFESLMFIFTGIQL